MNRKDAKDARAACRSPGARRAGRGTHGPGRAGGWQEGDASVYLESRPGSRSYQPKVL